MEQFRRERISAIVLAAGLSRRMGALKGLLPIGRMSFVSHIVQRLDSTREFEGIYIVTGHASEKVQAALQGWDVTLVHNPAYMAGEMLSSVQAGVRALGQRCEAMLIAAVDQPMVLPQTIEQLVKTWRGTRAGMVRPRHMGRSGHPILLDARGSEQILALPHDSSLKAYTRAHAEETVDVDVDDPAIHEDIDTPGDYVRAMQRWVAQQRSELCRSERSAASPALEAV